MQGNQIVSDAGEYAIWVLGELDTGDYMFLGWHYCPLAFGRHTQQLMIATEDFVRTSVLIPGPTLHFQAFDCDTNSVKNYQVLNFINFNFDIIFKINFPPAALQENVLQCFARKNFAPSGHAEHQPCRCGATAFETPAHLERRRPTDGRNH